LLARAPVPGKGGGASRYAFPGRAWEREERAFTLRCALTGSIVRYQVVGLLMSRRDNGISRENGCAAKSPEFRLGPTIQEGVACYAPTAGTRSVAAVFMVRCPLSGVIAGMSAISLVFRSGRFQGPDNSFQILAGFSKIGPNLQRSSQMVFRLLPHGPGHE